MDHFIGSVQGAASNLRSHRPDAMPGTRHDIRRGQLQWSERSCDERFKTPEEAQKFVDAALRAQGIYRNLSPRSDAVPL